MGYLLPCFRMQTQHGRGTDWKLSVWILHLLTSRRPAGVSLPQRGCQSGGGGSGSVWHRGAKAAKRKLHLLQWVASRGGCLYPRESSELNFKLFFSLHKEKWVLGCCFSSCWTCFLFLVFMDISGVRVWKRLLEMPILEEKQTSPSRSHPPIKHKGWSLTL